MTRRAHTRGRAGGARLARHLGTRAGMSRRTFGQRLGGRLQGNTGGARTSVCGLFLRVCCGVPFNWGASGSWFTRNTKVGFGVCGGGGGGGMGVSLIS